MPSYSLRVSFVFSSYSARVIPTEPQDQPGESIELMLSFDSVSLTAIQTRSHFSSNALSPAVPHPSHPEAAFNPGSGLMPLASHLCSIGDQDH